MQLELNLFVGSASTVHPDIFLPADTLRSDSSRDTIGHGCDKNR